MRINARILLIILTVVAFVSITSTIIYNSLAITFLQSQHSKTLLNSTNLFIFSFQLQLEKVDDDFQEIISENDGINSLDLSESSVDFVFTLLDDDKINSENLSSKNYVVNTASLLNNFLRDNKNAILKYKTINGETYYYGFIITDELLTEISRNIQAEISLIVDSNLMDVSNVEANRPFNIHIEIAYEELKYKNNFDLFGEELENNDFLASIYTPNNILTPSGKISFLIFSVSKDAFEFRETMKFIAALIIGVSITLSIITVLIFTTKLRKQISFLSTTAELTSKGNLSHRTKIILKDEIGKFGEAFNNMLDKLMAKEKAEKDYSDFIALLNKNPTLIEVSDQALIKIINSTGLTLGLLYLVENDQLRIVSSYGISDRLIKPSGEIDFYKNVIKKKEITEFEFKENNPVIKTGIAEIRIEYLLVAPIIYNQKVIAVIELASEKKPAENVKSYIEKIQEQLAVGLTNAKALEQLENIVDELKELNEQYQKQNKQITEQNNTLIELHEKLKLNADELGKQRERAVELTRVKSDFLASMSHELRTPLNSILGLTELVVKDTLTNVKSRERLNIVLRNGNKLLTLINNILEFSKIETGNIELKIEDFKLKKFADEIFSFIEPLILEKKLNFSLNFDFDNDIVIKSDKSKIEQIIINLLGNAVKFTDGGSVKLEFKLMKNDLEIIVEDTGIGIEENNLAEIFNEFKQLDSSTSRSYGGTGLGLAICRKYIQSLNGTISVESRFNVGSKFTVKLPDIVTNHIEFEKIKNLKLKSSINKEVQNSSVLIINSNRQSQKLIGDYLRNNNFQVETFSNGNEALEYIKKNTPSSVIIDVNIQDVTPWDFVFKAYLYIDTKIPVIVTSIDESRRVGYGFNVNKYVKASSYQDVTALLQGQNEIKNILFYTGRNLEKELFKDRQTNIKVVNEINGPVDEYKNYDLIVINIIENYFGGIDFYFNLKKSKVTRNIPIVFELPEKLESGLSKELKNKIMNLAITENHHPMDVLKVIRDRLKIFADPQNIIDNEGENIELNSFTKNEDDSIIDQKSHGKVMIVDDDNDTLFTVGEIVNDMGFETVYARNGVDCLFTLKSNVPDIILLDIMMPQMDGFETIKRIRKNDSFSGLTIIALTAYAMLDNKEIIEKNGFNDLITKPVNTEELKTKLIYYMNKISRKVNE